MFWKRKKPDRASKLVVNAGTLAKLSQIAQAHEATTGEKLSIAQANMKLIDSYFEAPLSPLGKQMSEVMMGYSDARQKISKMESRADHPLFELWDSLPKEAQQAIIQKLAGGVLGGQSGDGQSLF